LRIRLRLLGTAKIAPNTLTTPRNPTLGFAIRTHFGVKGKRFLGICWVPSLVMFDIGALLQTEFGIGPVEVQDSGTGQATTRRYVLRSPDGKWIAKHYGEYFRDKVEWVRFECELLTLLAAQGQSVARNVATISGDPFTLVDGTPLVVYEWAEGGIEWPASSQNSGALGAALARMHLASEGLSLSGTERIYDVDRLIDRPLALLKPYSDPNAHKRLASLSEKIKTAIGAIPTVTPFFGPIHGDIHQGNCHFQEDGRLAIFDFALSGVGYRAYDLTGFLWPMRDATIEDPAMRVCCEAFLVGYESVRELASAERAAISAFVQVRSLWESGDWVDAGSGRDQPEEVAKAAPYLVRQMDASLD